MEPSTLERSINSLDTSLGRWGVFIVAMTALVGVGLILECLYEIPDAIKERKEKKNWRPLLVVAGVILITIGVLGEFIGEYEAGDKETQLRKDNDQLEYALAQEVESAQANAKGAADEASRAKGLADAAGVVAGNAKKLADDATGRTLALEREQQEVAKGLEGAEKAEVGFRKYVEAMQVPYRVCEPIHNCIEEYADPAVRKKWRDEVAKFSGTRAIIQPLANNAPAADVARQVADLLAAEGWFPEIVDEEHSHIPNGYIFPGVQLVTLEPSPFRYGTPPEVKLVPVEPSPLFRAEVALLNLLALDLGPSQRLPNLMGVRGGSELDDEHTRQWTRYGFRFPPNTMLIVVGDKPEPNWFGTDVPMTVPVKSSKTASKPR